MLSGSDAPNYPLGLTRRSTQWRSWLPHRKRPPGKVPRFPVRPPCSARRRQSQPRPQPMQPLYIVGQAH